MPTSSMFQFPSVFSTLWVWTWQQISLPPWSFATLFLNRLQVDEKSSISLHSFDLCSLWISYSLCRGTLMMHNAQMDFLPIAELVKVLSIYFVARNSQVLTNVMHFWT